MRPEFFTKRTGRGHVIGKRPDLENRFFRSAWEANYARYLNWMKQRGEIKAWEYETTTFEFETIKRGSRFYTPDFKLIFPDGRYEFHEIKGYMDRVSATKLRRMKKYHPEVPLVLIDKDAYRQLARNFGTLLEGWEGRYGLRKSRRL